MSNEPTTSTLRGTITLSLASIIVAAVWLLLLPWLAHRPAMQARLDFLDQRGIDPSAMYYTELEVMDQILDRIEGRNKSPQILK